VIASFETVLIQAEDVTADLLIWRRYRRPAPGMLEAMLDANPNLARVHKYGPFLPVGLQVRIPIDPDILSGSPAFGTAIGLYGPVTP